MSDARDEHGSFRRSTYGRNRAKDAVTSLTSETTSWASFGAPAAEPMILSIDAAAESSPTTAADTDKGFMVI